MGVLIVTERLYIAKSLERDCAEGTGGSETRSITNMRELGSVCSEFRPEVIAFDGELLPEFGLRLIRDMRANAGDRAKIVGFAFGCDHVTTSLIRQSALAGYLLLGELGPNELIGAIIRIRNGEKVFSPTVQKMLEDQLTWKIKVLRELSETQQLLLGLIGCGLNNTEIGQVLGLQVQSVKNQQTHIAKLFQIKTSAKLVRFAIEMGFAIYALGGNPMDSKFRLAHSTRIVTALQSYMHARFAAVIREARSMKPNKWGKVVVGGAVYYQAPAVTVKTHPLDKTVISEMKGLAPR